MPAERWVFTRTDPRAGSPTVDVRSDNAGVYRVDDPSAWRGQYALRGAGGQTVGASHGQSVVTPMVPSTQIKALPMFVVSDDETIFNDAIADLWRAVGPVTQARGVLDLVHHRWDGRIASGTVRVVDVETDWLIRRAPGVCGQRALSVLLEVEVVDGVLFSTTEDTTVVALAANTESTVVVTNGGDVEDVWATIEIAENSVGVDVECVTVENLDWPGASPRGNPVGFTLYADEQAAADDDGTSSPACGTVVNQPLQGFVVDSGLRTAVDASGTRRDGLLVRRDWHAHLLPLHPGDNQIRVVAGDGGADVTIRRHDPYQ